MDKGRLAVRNISLSLAYVIALSLPAFGQGAATEKKTELPPVVVVTTDKPKAPKRKSAAKKPSPSQGVNEPQPASVPTDMPTPPSDSGVPSLGLPPISKTSYVIGISKSELSSNQAANPASTTVIRYSEETTRLVRNYNDLLKSVTGVTANDFDQSGIGFGLVLRGFSERSNGGQVAVYIDGLPVNQTGHRLTNGYANLSWLVPELIDSFTLTRGPFDVRAGAHALAGSVHYTTADVPTPGVLLKGGSFDFARGFGVYGFGAGEITGYGSLTASTRNAFRDNSDWEQVNAFNKAVFPMFDGKGTVRFQVYEDDFGSPGFLDLQRLRNGEFKETAARNVSDGGDTSMQNLVFNYKQNGNQPITANAYVIHTDHNRYSSRGNAQLVPTNPETPGIQALAQDDRVTYGGSIDKYFQWIDPSSGMGADLLVGAGVQVDNAETGLFNTTNRRIISVSTPPSGLVDFSLVDPFAYIQGSLKPVSWLKLTGGFRYDQLYYDIDDRLSNTGVSASKSILQPKAGITVTPFAGFDVFANYGEGFRPPSPLGDQLLNNPQVKESILETKEVGVQYSSPDGIWHFLASTYYTTFTNEIQGQPPPTLPISLGPSIRTGYDIEGRVRAYEYDRTKLSFYGSYSHIDNKLVITTPTSFVIPDIPDFLVKYGLEYTTPIGGGSSPHLISLSVGQVWEGPKSLNAANAFRTDTFSRIDAGLTYRNEDWRGFAAFVNAVIYPDSRVDETQFLFNGRPATSPKAPVTVQAGVFIPF